MAKHNLHVISGKLQARQKQHFFSRTILKNFIFLTLYFPSID